MPDEEERLERDKAVAALNKALRLQYRSVIQYTIAAGGVVGVENQALGERFWINAQDDLADARRLIEKIVALGGKPKTTIAGVDFFDDPAKLVDHLIETESECVDAMQDAIATTGREGASEALEHRLEHMIMRKQEAVDFLLRARMKP